MDGTDINSVDRSHNSSLVAAADDFGRVRVFNYPCTTKGAAFVEALGHSSHVMGVRFSADDNTIFTAGGNDRAILQFGVASTTRSSGRSAAAATAADPVGTGPTGRKGRK